MESDSADCPSGSPPSVSQAETCDVEAPTPYVKPPTPATTGQDNLTNDSLPILSTSGLTSWAKNLKIAHSSGEIADSQSENTAKSALARFTSGLGLHFPPAAPSPDKNVGVTTTTATSSGVLESLTKGVVASSRSAVKAVQVKARHMVSQNKRRYQEGGYDLDMSYITENIIAMGFPAGDMSSGFFGYVEGFYRNHIEEVIRFLETHHQGKYKVYNLCSERLYDASLFHGKAACFPFDDHNCPPLQLILLFCESAYTWLKEDIENVVVIHCKAGMGRTGLMISSLLLYLKFCPTAEESIDYFNQKRCIDGKGLVLPSQIRYVKYFERILKDYNGKNQPGRRCMLRGFRLHGCPYWIRPSITISDHNGVLFTTRKHPKTKDLMPEDFWINTSKKGIVVFALPGERGLTELTGDFKIHFHDRHGDFYCWFNTTLMENRTLLSTDDLDGFDKRKLPSPRFHVVIVMIDYDGTIPERPNPDPAQKGYVTGSDQSSVGNKGEDPKSGKEDKDDVFSDSDGEGESVKKQAQTSVEAGAAADAHTSNVVRRTEQLSIKEPSQTKPSSTERAGKPVSGLETPRVDSSAPTDFKAIAADASVFSFGDEDDYDSE